MGCFGSARRSACLPSPVSRLPPSLLPPKRLQDSKTPRLQDFKLRISPHSSLLTLHSAICDLETPLLSVFYFILFYFILFGLVDRRRLQQHPTSQQPTSRRTISQPYGQGHNRTIEQSNKRHPFTRPVSLLDQPSWIPLNEIKLLSVLRSTISRAEHPSQALL